jgi:hypothetical protein
MDYTTAGCHGQKLYAAYRDWSERSGEYTRRSNDFATAMMAAGYKKIGVHGRSFWVGIELEITQQYGNSSRSLYT